MKLTTTPSSCQAAAIPVGRPAGFRLVAWLLFACLSVCAGAAAAAQRAPARRAPAQTLGSTPWLLTAGTRSSVEGTVQCVPLGQEPRGVSLPGSGSASGPASGQASGRMSARVGAVLRANALGTCEGSVRFSYEALWYLSVVSASINGVGCTSTQWFVACPVLLAVGESATVSTELDAGPYARGSTEVAVSGVDNPLYQPIEFQTEGSITVAQAPALVVPGVNRSGTTELSLRASGPSGARDVQLSEQFPAFITASSDDPACRFESLQGRLSCAWAHVDPGATVRVPIQISAGAGYPTSQLSTQLQARCDLGTAGAVASIVVSGSLVAGEQSLDAPPRVIMDSVLVDHVSLHTLPGASRGAPPPGIPARWTVSFSPGLQVQGVTPAEDSRDLVCTYSDDSVSCSAPNYGSDQPGTNANAAIRLSAVQPGRQTATLRWESTQGVGTTSLSVQVFWDPASPEGGPGSAAASSPRQGEEP